MAWRIRSEAENPLPSCCACDHSRAVAAALAKMRPFMPTPAFCEAALYTFSKMRGTASMKDGLNSPKSDRMVLRLLDSPSSTSPAKQYSPMYRANA